MKEEKYREEGEAANGQIDVETPSPGQRSDR